MLSSLVAERSSQVVDPVQNKSFNSLLSGDSEFQEFFFVELPLLMFYCSVVLYVLFGGCHAAGTCLIDGFRGCHSKYLERAAVLQAATSPATALMLIGILGIASNMISNTIFDCINPVIKSTVSSWPTKHTTPWQWVWVLCNCTASVPTAVLLIRLGRWQVRKKVVSPQARRWLDLFISVWIRHAEHGPRHAIKVWRVNTSYAYRLPILHKLLLLLLHLFVLCVAMIPSAGYVLASNLHVSEMCCSRLVFLQAMSLLKVPGVSPFSVSRSMRTHLAAHPTLYRQCCRRSWNQVRHLQICFSTSSSEVCSNEARCCPLSHAAQSQPRCSYPPNTGQRSAPLYFDL